MTTTDDFSHQVKDVLSHLYDYPYLEGHPLASRFWPNTEQAGPNRAQRLSRLFLETIEALYPPSASAQETSRARSYLLLVYRYVEEWPLENIMDEFGYSRRHFFREQRKAIELLAAALQEKLLPVSASPGPAEESLDTEVERFLTSQRAVDITEVVQGTLSLVKKLAQEHNVALSCQGGANLPPVYGSRTLLRQVFLNCLSHLITQPNTQQIELKLQSEKQTLQVELSAHLAGSLSSPQPEFESVRHLLKKLGGRWQEPSFTRENIVCRFTLPTSGEKVLLVIEDNESVIKAFRRYLSGYNYQIVGVTSSTDALQMARTVVPSAITLDIMMPNQDGWETLHALKYDPETKHIPVVICSVLEDPDLAISLGAAGYLRKPVAQTDLLTLLNQLTGAG
jgi:CheY-like chemotaxis protein